MASGRTVLITGTNSGIGLETARALAAGGARVLMLCRSVPRATAARDEILRTAPDADLEIVECDPTDPREIWDQNTLCGLV